MINTVQFLKNYDVFASQARYYTAQLFLDELKNNAELKPNNIKLMKLRIIEEFISATEDLALWLLTVNRRVASTKLDIWDQLLLAEATPEDAVLFLQSLGRLKSHDSILNRLNLISSSRLRKQLGLNEKEIEESLEYIIKSIKSTIFNRRINNGALLRTHNKIKHGMVVYLDAKNIDKLLIKDLKMVGQRNKKRRRYRYFEINFDLNRAEKLVGNIQTISHAIRGLIYLVQADFRYRIINGRHYKKTKNFWIAELDKTDLE